MISNPGLQKRIRDALYQLKLDYGVKCDVYKLVSSATTYESGLKTNVTTKTPVRRAIKMPAMTYRANYISPYFTQTNKPFITKGAGWDEVSDVFIFDGRDLPNHDFNLGDWIVWNHVRFEVKDTEEIGDGAGWVVGTTLAKGSPPHEIHTQLVEQDLGISDSSEETVE